MSENAILFAKPGAVQPADREALRDIGIIVIEVESLDDVKLVRPESIGGADLPHSEMLKAFALALHNGNSSETKKAFAEAVGAMILARDTP